jgi:integrase
MEHKRVFIPTDEELQLAVNCGIKSNLIFSKLVDETGCRANEASRVEWTDIDQERNKVSIKASKHGNARILTISKGLINQLLTLPKTEKTVFPKRKRGTHQKAFRERMKKLARLHTTRES